MSYEGIETQDHDVEEWPDVVCELSALSEREEYILERRPEKTLDEIGLNLSITRERVRQLERVANSRLAHTAEMVASKEVDALYATLAQNLTIDGGALSKLISNKSWKRSRLVARALGVVEAKVWSKSVSDQFSRSSVALQGAFDQLVTLAPFSEDQVVEYAKDLLIPDTMPVANILERSESGLIRHKDGPWWVRKVAKNRDAAYLILRDLGEAQDLAVFTARIDSRAQALRESMRRDSRFVQIRPTGTWALVEWDSSVLSAPRSAGEAVRLVLSEIGPMTPNQLAARLRDIYPVTSWRVNQVLAAEGFGTFPDGRVGLIEDGATVEAEESPVKPSSVAVSADGNLVACKLEVSFDVLRGSGIPVHRFVPWSLGLRVIPSARTFVVEGSDCEEIVLRRHTGGPAVSSLRSIAERLGAVLGCKIALVFNDTKSAVKAIHGCPPGLCLNPGFRDN